MLRQLGSFGPVRPNVRLSFKRFQSEILPPALFSHGLMLAPVESAVEEGVCNCTSRPPATDQERSATLTSFEVCLQCGLSSIFLCPQEVRSPQRRPRPHLWRL